MLLLKFLIFEEYILASDIWKRLFPPGRNRGRLSSGLFLAPIPTRTNFSSSGIIISRNSLLSSTINNTSSTNKRMDLINPFRLCSGLKVLGYFMIVLVVSIIALSYYAVVLLTWAPHLLHAGFNSFFSFFIIILFHYLVTTSPPPVLILSPLTFICFLLLFLFFFSSALSMSMYGHSFLEIC